ncbi:MAG: TetR family transcriptional regulator [Alphaproteobacteria bacterium]|nr:MAG: TetR family transcriptional regulator [Caulobacteraceae bacterium]TPW04908.1 MAG: TetR family transcriptional regulator [Alphaproteobacteria bacterium]
MTRRTDPKAAMIEAATTLFRRRGYEGVGVAELLAFSGAPRGSLYFHFPGGKEQIAIEAVTRAGVAVRDGIRARGAITGSVEEYIDTALNGWAENLVASDYENGCIIALVGLEAASASPALKKAADDAFTSWETELRDMAMSKGLDAERGARFATAFICAVEGSIMMARTRNATAPLMTAKDSMIAYVRTLYADMQTHARKA